MTQLKTSNNILQINLNALANNYKLLMDKANDSCAVAGVIKANAYGLGLKEISQKLTELNCPIFFVATLEEALELRTYNKTTPIQVLGGLTQKEEENYFNYKITPVLNSLEDINRWKNFAAQTQTPLPSTIHIDTGMNRLGLRTKDVHNLIDNKSMLEGLNIHLIMSHFVCADNAKNPRTKEQANLFYNIFQHFPKTQKSIANSSGTFRSNDYHHDLIRPGYALYGGNPTPERKNPMQPVVNLQSTILQIHECKKGESIGYDATHIFEKNTRTATIALGYADGFLRSGSSKSVLYYNNQPCPVLGRISMDLVSIDISRVKEKTPQQGDKIEILGPNQTIDDLANSSGTIGYEILTSLGNRYKREYIN